MVRIIYQDPYNPIKTWEVGKLTLKKILIGKMKKFKK